MMLRHQLRPDGVSINVDWGKRTHRCPPRTASSSTVRVHRIRSVHDTVDGIHGEYRVVGVRSLQPAHTWPRQWPTPGSGQCA